MLENYLTDAVRTKLFELLMEPIWKEVLNGLWADPIDFFQLFEDQIEVVTRLKENGDDLHRYLLNLNPITNEGGESDMAKPCPEGSGCSYAQFFLLTSLRIETERRSRSDVSFLPAIADLRDVCSTKLVNLIEQYSEKRLPEITYLLFQVGQENTLNQTAEFIAQCLQRLFHRYGMILVADETLDDLLSVPQRFLPVFENFNGVYSAHHRMCDQLYFDGCRVKSLSILEKLAGCSENISSPALTADGVAEMMQPNEITTLRRKLIALMLLTFGRLDVPPGLKQARVVEFFHQLIGGNKQNLRVTLSGLVKVRTKRQSIWVIEDLNKVRDQLSKLGLVDNVSRIVNELDCLIEEIETDQEIKEI